MEEEYKNYPFYDWVPKPLGIIFMIILFVPMITMSGVFLAVLLRTGVHPEREDDVYRGILHSLFAQFCLRPDRFAVHPRTVQSADGLCSPDASDGASLCTHPVWFRH